MKKGNLNAIKHGVFAEMILLPGENREEFGALHKALREEWDPRGPTQEDKVFNIAHNMWRKRRSGHYRKESVEDEEFALEIETAPLIKFLEDVEAGKPISELKLPAKWRDGYLKHFPRKNYDSDGAWREALADAVSALLEIMFVERQKRTKERVVKQCDATAIAGELALEERIDAKIDKDIMSLGRMKTMQSMGLGRRRNGQAIEGESMKQVDSPPMQAEGSTVKVDEGE
jgi:hypothetical protein